jgi:predicted ABC-type ATPase
MTSPRPPELWIVAGPNGAGKTTCVQKEPISGLLPGVRFLNPDDRTLTKLRGAGYGGFADAPLDVQSRLFIESADEVLLDLQADVAAGEPVGVETVLSSGKYRSLVDHV